MARSRPRLLRIVVRLIVAAVLIALVAVAAGWLSLRGSMPTLQGTRPLRGLSGAVTVERDADGVPTVRARNREDLFRALGFLHAQDRFLQMDLLRRQGAGEVSEIVGASTLTLDRDSREHGFRRRAAAVVAALPPQQLRIIDAYVEGVNAGLAALTVRPWEYLALRAAPRPWSREDCILVVDAMSMSLESDGSDERARVAIAQTYGEETLAFLRPAITENSAALDGSSAPAPPVPDRAGLTPRSIGPGEGGAKPAQSVAKVTDPEVDEMLPGSNSFALAGNRTKSGAAMVANDPHLRLAVPNVWYRASLALPEVRGTGATLPGVPALVIGSNGHVAWGFTNSYIDTCDLVVVEVDPADRTRYRVPDGTGWERFEIVHESIGVHGRGPEAFDVPMTRWGPLVTKPGEGGVTYARHYSEYDPGAINLDLVDLLGAQNVEEAVTVAHRSGIHPQNFVVGDTTGNLAWTIIGRVPWRVGFDGSRPESWANGTRRWNGFLPPDEVPTIRNPPEGQLWTANNRIVGGAMLAQLGDSGYDGPFRSGQIRDRLTAMKGRGAEPADLLAVQLDDEAIYLRRWRELLLATLTDAAVEGQPALGELRDIVRNWNGHASVDAVGYRLVREFRRLMTSSVFDPIMVPVLRRDPTARLGPNSQQPLWSIIQARPSYLLPKDGATWEEVLLRAARATTKLGERQHPAPLPLAKCTWGAYNVLAMRHPLSGALPGGIGRRIDMPAQQLPGDSNMPRVQGPSFGASLRMVVSPGREEEGIYEQPGGASGNPMSDFYRAGHENWAAGKRSAFLPGPAKYRLELTP